MSALQLAVRPDGVAVLTFDQPGSRANVLTADLWAEFEAALDALVARTDLKGLVLASAKPGVFIAGADLNLLANAPGPNDPAVRGFIEQGLRVLEKLEALPFPTCAAIDGAALGGGLEVAIACDCRVAGDNPKVRLGLPEVTLGLIPGWGGTQRLPRIVGTETAAEMLTTGRPLDAAVAAARGLVSQVTTSAELTEAAARITASPHGSDARARKLGPIHGAGALAPLERTGAAAEAVRVMVEGAALPLKQAIALETEAFLRLAGSDESKRLIAAFFASRKK
ncbi:enoyl-CoA hydratase-related protein [Gemmata sp.]|uniref:enoyl-CoA hydratase-related protein n=1 Tax=Gemmata sp. TaxID=1914242 RepID=UPI003F7154D2